MSRKKCHRKQWGAPATAAARAIITATATGTTDLDKLRANELMAIAAFTQGRAKLEDLNVACGLVNLTEYMARQNIGPEALEACARAEVGLREAMELVRKTGRVAMGADGVAALRDVHQYHDLQRQSVPRHEYAQLIRGTIAAVAKLEPVEVVL